MPPDAKAEEVLQRFGPQIKWVTESVCETFAPDVELEDLRQEASILLMSYAGIMPGRLHGKLADWEAEAEGDETRVRALLAAQLRKDLSQIVAREVEKLAPTISIEDLPPGQEPADETFEDRVIDKIDQESKVRREFPYLSRQILDGASIDEIVEEMKVSRRTVDYRIADEKADLAVRNTTSNAEEENEMLIPVVRDVIQMQDRDGLRFIREYGLHEFLVESLSKLGPVVEGDETAEELATAYLYATAR